MAFSFLDLDNNDFDRSTEEKKMVMNKTIYTSTDPEEDVVKVDHLDTNNEVEKDAVKVKKSERDVKGTVPLPLFRFEEKQKQEILELIKFLTNIGRDIMKNSGSNYTPLVSYIEVPDEKDILHLLNLTVSRNKELYTTAAKELDIEIITCYYDKKLRVELNIEEDKVLDEKNKEDLKYLNKEKLIKNSFIAFFEELIEKADLKKTGINRYIEIHLDNSEGGDKFGVGISIFVKYTKPIDYSNKVRGAEVFNGLLDEVTDISKNLIHNNINLTQSTEAIGDGMSENSDEGDENDDQETGDDENVEEEESDGNDEFDMGDDDGEGDDEEFGGDDESGDDSGSSGDSGGGSLDLDKQPGLNPFSDINSREKISMELKALKLEVDKALTNLEQFKQNVLVLKMQELSEHIADALRNVYIVKIEDSMIRYNLYIAQFEDLVEALKRSFRNNKLKKVKK